MDAIDADITRPHSVAPSPAPRRDTLAGMGLMATSSFLFMTGNAIIKYLGQGGMPGAEIVFFRSVMSLVILTPFALATPGVLATRRLGRHLARGVIQAASMICFFSGLAWVSLVESNALEFTAPIFATAIAMLFFGERIRARRLAAMAVGFAGALIALRPGFNVLNMGHGLVLLSSVLWAVVLLMIRDLSQTESALRQSLFFGFTLTPLSAAIAIPIWVTPSWSQLGLMAIVGGTATAGQYVFAQSFRLAEMSAVLPLDFSKLIWSTLIGYLFFATLPDGLTLLGATVIFAAGVYITVREAQLQQRVARTGAAALGPPDQVG